MDFDYKRYAEAFARFLKGIAKIDSPTSDQFPIILKDCCEILKVGRVDSIFFNKLSIPEKNNGQLTICYENIYDADTFVEFKESTVENNSVIYRFYLSKDAEYWNKLELGRIENLSSIMFNYSGRANMLKIIDKLKTRDAEFGIPNMMYFNRELKKIHKMGKLSQYGLCFYNLKKFAAINQKFGRNNSTQIMRSFVIGLQSLLGNDGQVGRLGGDNFIVLFKKDKINAITKYLAGTEISLSDETKVLIKSSAGVFMIPEGYNQVEQIFENAHLSLQAARNNLGTSTIFYNENLKKHSDRINSIEGLFTKALEKREFLVYYQPKVQLDNYSLKGAEALCRWMHDGKLVPPNDFIPILEQSNNICLLDFYMLEHVCQDIRRWINEGKQVVRVSVNLSRRHMGDHLLVQKLISIIDSYNVPHEYIEIEVTETTTDIEFNELKQLVQELHKENIKVSVDDFGVGYSSLNLIRQIPWDVIKIDKSFLPENIKKNSKEKSMLGHILSMIQDMGFTCIVEGIETLDQIKVLKENNCFYAQGYFFDKPLPEKEFEQRLIDYQKMEDFARL